MIQVREDVVFIRNARNFRRGIVRLSYVYTMRAFATFALDNITLVSDGMIKGGLWRRWSVKGVYTDGRLGGRRGLCD